MIAVSLPDENGDDGYLDPDELEDLCASHGFEYVEGTVDRVPGLSPYSGGPGSNSNTLDNWYRRGD
jgi:hypothetical protein